MGRFFMFQAESAYTKAREMATQAVPKEERIKLFQRACDQFLRAYDHDSSLFSVNRIEMAIESCTWAKDVQAKELFLSFEADYLKVHPVEAEYGDAVPLPVE